MKPSVLIVGADKGGVGKTTVSRVMLDYLAVNNRGSLTRAFDTEPAPGVLKRFFPDQTEIVDFTVSEGHMRVLDTLKTTPITLIDTKAGVLTSSLQTFEDIGYLDKAKNGTISLTVMHVLGANMASFAEIKATAEKLAGARHFLIKNSINDNSFFKWNPEMSAFLAGGVVEVPKMDPNASEHVDLAGCSFEAFCKEGRPDTSEVLQGYVRHWLRRVYANFDRALLNTI
jgi:hypothetical protein